MVDDTVIFAILGTLYAFPAAVMGVYSFYRMYYLVILACHRRDRRPKPGRLPTRPQPFVTIQLPMFNEFDVAERAVRAACRIEWPRDRLEIQLLDDSMDGRTTQRLERAVADLKAAGNAPFIELVRRPKNVGYKAGACQEGLDIARGEFVAIFDADFIPSKDFLHSTVPHFFESDGSSNRVGVVQGVWGYLNRYETVLTRAQASWLDGHFFLDQYIRSIWFRAFNFNGTGGIWRKKTIYEAGGWSWDTVTEDAELSYRAYCAGYEFRFVETLIQPSELPSSASIYKGQQRRWTKGHWQTVRKLMVQVWSSSVPLGAKIDITFTLTATCNYALAVLMFAASPVWAFAPTRSYLFVTLWLMAAPAIIYYVCAAFLKVKVEKERLRQLMDAAAINDTYESGGTNLSSRSVTLRGSPGLGSRFSFAMGLSYGTGSRYSRGRGGASGTSSYRSDTVPVPYRYCSPDLPLPEEAVAAPAAQTQSAAADEGVQLCVEIAPAPMDPAEVEQIDDDLFYLQFDTFSSRSVLCMFLIEIWHICLMSYFAAGMSVAHTQALFEGLFSKDATFVKTDKSGSTAGASAQAETAPSKQAATPARAAPATAAPATAALVMGAAANGGGSGAELPQSGTTADPAPDAGSEWDGVVAEENVAEEDEPRVAAPSKQEAADEGVTGERVSNAAPAVSAAPPKRTRSRVNPIYLGIAVVEALMAVILLGSAVLFVIVSFQDEVRWINLVVLHSSAAFLAIMSTSFAFFSFRFWQTTARSMLAARRERQAIIPVSSEATEVVV